MRYVNTYINITLSTCIEYVDVLLPVVKYECSHGRDGEVKTSCGNWAPFHSEHSASQLKKIHYKLATTMNVYVCMYYNYILMCYALCLFLYVNM